MKRFGIVIHSGAGPDSDFLRSHKAAYEAGLQKAVNAGYAVLSTGGAAVEAVEASVREMEDNELFNAGRGGTLNCRGEVELFSSIMDGKTLRGGAACLLKHVKNPITFATTLLRDGRSQFIGGPDAIAFARELGLEMLPMDYFIVPHQMQNYVKEKVRCAQLNRPFNPANHGTVGAVALDQSGDLAAGTSTGGSIFSQAGRIGDSSILGIGTYANNRSCAVSCTGDGESIMIRVLAHSVHALYDLGGMDLKETCENLIRQKKNSSEPDLGLIVVDKDGNYRTAFNTERMGRACCFSDGEQICEVYP